MPLTRSGYDTVSRGLAKDLENEYYTVPAAIGKGLLVLALRF